MSNGVNVKSAIESVLFVQGAPLAISRLARVIGASKKEIEAALGELAAEYRERGIMLVRNGEEAQFATNPAQKQTVEKLLASDLAGELTRAGLEVLAIVAYKGPVSRAKIEYVRGVDSSFTLRNLLMRGLVAREENPQDRSSYLYRISMEFLNHLSRAETDVPEAGETPAP